MKLLLSCWLATTSAAWIVTEPRRASSSALAAMSRREAVLTAAAALTVTPRLAAADIDYSKVQDLLGAPDTSEASSTAQYAGGRRPTWLTEPTPEFKENEAKAAGFKRAQLEQKKKFLAVLDKLDTDPNQEDLLAGDLDELRKQVRAKGGLPEGVSKDELRMRIRRRKAKRYWPTSVEIAYQDLMAEIGYQQSPNTDRDMDNPF